MGYKIQYSGNHPVSCSMKTGKKPMILLCYILLFVLAVAVIGVKYSPVLKEFLLPGDPKVIQLAGQRMIDQIQEGTSVGDAITSFCAEIVRYGLEAA